ncbi:unnamed protein product [Discula destructiva]
MARKYHREIISEKPSADGRGMIITEKDIRCTGSDCRHCERHARRPSKLDFMSSNSRDKTYSSVDDRLPTPYDFAFRPEPDAKQRRRERSSSDRDRYYSGGDGYSLSRSNSMRGTSNPLPIPRPAPRRSYSMYEGDMYDSYYNNSARDSRSRPTLHQDGGHYRDSGRRYSDLRQESARVPLGFYDVLDSSRPGTHSSGRRRSASPLDFPQKTEEYDPERRRLRSKTQAKPAISYGASPLAPTFESSPYGSLRTSEFSHPATLSASPPPKSVRWDDEQRAAQNERIQSRHARHHSVSAGVGTGGGGDTVKSILKHATETGRASSPLAPAVQPLSSEQYDALYKSAQNIGVEDRATTPQRQVLQKRSARGEEQPQHESYDMIEGLRRRISNYDVDSDRRYSSFDMPPRRFTWGEKASSRGRRPERFYDDSRRDSFYY